MKKTNKQNQAFTIVELLIVIVVIAILAAISIVVYTGVQGRANDAVVKQDLAQFARKIEIAKIDNDDIYPATLTPAMGFSFSKSAYMVDSQSYTLRYCRNSSSNQYIFYARSKSGNYFKATPSGVSEAIDVTGWSICTQIGLVQTNPSQNGFNGDIWEDWTN